MLTWGDPAAPKLFLLHGWMDVAASFQFLVDALARDWYAIAPDLRGYGRSAWQPQGYWFPDYVADLEALLDAFAPGEAVDARRPQPRRQHRACTTPACGRSACAPSCRSTASASRPRTPARRRAKFARLARRADGAGGVRALREHRRRRRRGCRRTTRGCRATGRCFLARHWAEALPDGTARLASDPRHKLPFPTVYRLEEVYAVWRAIDAPVLWVAGADSNIPQWLDEHPRRRAVRTDPLAGVRRRLAHIRERPAA